MMRYFYILGFVAACVSCKPDHSKALSEIDMMSAQLSGLEATFQSIDIDKVLIAKKAYDDNMDYVRKYIPLDTMPEEFERVTATYKLVRKNGKNIYLLFEDNTLQLPILKKQLENLKSDVKNNLIPVDSVPILIAAERKNVEYLNEKVTLYVGNAQTMIDIHDSLAQKVRDFVVKLNEVPIAGAK